MQRLYVHACGKCLGMTRLHKANVLGIWVVVWSTISLCSASIFRCAEKESEGIASCTFNQLTAHLQNVIQKHKNVDDISVADFLKDTKWKCVWRGRFVNETVVQSSEHHVYYKNECDKEAKFIHTCKNDQMSSVTVQTSKGHTIGISGGPSFGAFGSNFAFSGGYGYSRAKTHQQNKGQGASQSTTVEVTVGKGETIVIKEMLYDVKQQADCILELVLEEGQKFRKKSKKNDEVKVTSKDFQPEWARTEDNLIFCTVTDKCTFLTTQRAVISSKTR